MSKRHDVMIVAPAIEAKFRYTFFDGDNRERTFEFYATDFANARQFLDDLKASLEEKPEIDT